MNHPMTRRHIAAIFLGLVVSVAAGGYAFEVVELGWNDADGVVRITAGVKADIAAMVSSLERVSELVSDRRPLIVRAAADPASARELFGVLAQLSAPQVSVTVHAADGTPIAWAGRPSDLPRLVRARLNGPAALLVTPGSAGPSLVRLRPVADGEGPGARRLGTIVAERALPSNGTTQPGTGDAVAWPSSLVPVRLRTRYEGAGDARTTETFLLTGSTGEPLLEGRVSIRDVAAARTVWRRRVLAAMLGLGSLLLAWCAGAVLSSRSTSHTLSGGIWKTFLTAAAVVAARAVAWVAVPLASTVITPEVAPTSPSVLVILLRSPLDFLLTALAALALAALAVDGAIRLRVALRRWRRTVRPWSSSAVLFAVTQVAASVGMAAVLATHGWYVGLLARDTSVDLLSFSLHPWDPARLAWAVALLLLHAAVLWAVVAVLTVGLVMFRIGHGWGVRALWLGGWLLPVGIALWMAPLVSPGMSPWTAAPPLAFAMLVTWVSMRFVRWRRHASQAASIVSMFLALLLPSVSLYPSLNVVATRAKQHVIESRLAPQAMLQRNDLQVRVRHALEQIDRLTGLPDLALAAASGPTGPPPTDAAFLVWSQTDLGAFRLTSAVELYAGNGSLVSRFALNLPEYTSIQQTWTEAGCGWDLFEEVSPFGSEERRLLHAGRGLCMPGPDGPRMRGAIVIHAMLDYGALPFITSQNPYVELFRNERILDVDSSIGRDLDFVVYGWSQRPVYASVANARTLDRATFQRIYASRQPFWSRQFSSGRAYHVYFANDRGGIYALGYPVLSLVGHLVSLAELATLAGAVYALLLMLAGLARTTGAAGATRGRALLREIRASFYRKLFLAFVAAAVIPVLTLAFISRAYMTTRLRSDVEDAATRTTNVAQRVIEDYGRLQQRSDTTASTLTDDILVWISRLIDQDVNIYDGSRLVATSERDLFASGLLPTRTSADVYKAIVFDRRLTFVGDERAGQFPYMVAAAPARLGGGEAILTVPLTLRQQAIEREIDDLNRRILLAVVAFVLIGSALGYWMAERIADPVNRLQRATARIARGDLDARVTVTSSDELRRLVEAFNAMAAELQRQQGQLERTHRLEAWADMARQVAHEIKNPLTPIQLSAEHLRRVHRDRGEPLSPVLEDCVDSILGQVRLLRQIAAEFSSFASSPTPRPVATPPADLVAEVVGPYRAGLPEHVTLRVDVPSDLPLLWVDRTLIGRALTNVIENALHSMPAGGELSIAGRPAPDGAGVTLTVRDTGVGMDRAALDRIFEPYFSTKAIGTGLGLTISKRNVELHGGRISVASDPGSGTTVTLSMPATPPPTA